MRHAQIRMMESIMVGLVIMTIFGLMLQFYYNQKTMELEKTIEKAKQSEAIAVSQLILFSPEIKCNGVDYCVDLSKASAAHDYVRSIYSHIFGYGYIELHQTFPISYNLTIYNNSLQQYSSSYTYTYGVNIYNTSSKSNGFGYLTINKQYK